MAESVVIHNDPVDLSALKGQSVIITGGASGLGAATVTKFAAEGAYVTIADVQDQLGEELAKKISADGGKATYVHCDVCDFQSCTAAFKHAVKFSSNGTLDVALLYAGVIGNKKNLVELVMEGNEASLDTDPAPPAHAAIDINLTGTYNSAFLALHYFRLQPQTSGNDNQNGTSHVSPSLSPKKSLVFVGSMASYTDYPNNSAYAASKFGIRGLFRGVRHYAPRLNVRTNMLAPWFVHTPMTQFMADDLQEAGVKQGEGFTFTSADYVVEAAGHCAVSDVDGRAFAVMPEGWVDMNDDLEKGHGGDILLELIKRRLEAGDQLR